MRRFVYALNAALLLNCFLTLNAAASPVEKGDDVKKLIKQAQKLARKSLHPEAEKLLRQAVELAPDRPDAKIELAYVLTKQRQLAEAYDLGSAAVKIDPRNARALAVVGATLLAAGRFEDARSLFSTALKLDKGQHLAWAGYGMLDFYENRIVDSLENLKRAVFIEPDEPDYVFALAQVAARAEDYQTSAANYKRFLLIANITDADRRARIKGVISFLDFLGKTRDLYNTAGSSVATVPFELVGDRPVIELRVNDRKEILRFVLDTGSGISVLSQETASRLGIGSIAKGGFARGLGGDGKFEIVYGFIREVGIGDVEVENVPVYIRKFHTNLSDIDGYIGLALISKFLATIDYGNKSFSLTRRENDQREFREKAELSLPLRLTSSGFLSGEVEIEGMETPFNFIVDTGASVSVISDRVASLGGISRYLNESKLRVIGAAGVTDDVPTFLLPRVTFGPHSRERVMAVALDLDMINEASGFEQAGILGGNFLKNYSLTFDFKNSKVTFVPIK